MAAYRWVDDLVTCGLTACAPGSAPGPMLGNEMGELYFFVEVGQNIGLSATYNKQPDLTHTFFKNLSQNGLSFWYMYTLYDIFGDCECRHYKFGAPMQLYTTSHSFIHLAGAAVGRWQSFDVPFSLPPALRPRHGPVCNSPITLGLVLYVYRA